MIITFFNETMTFSHFIDKMPPLFLAYYFELNKTTRFTFLAAVLNATDSRLISTAVVISPYWVLTVAHLLPPYVLFYQFCYYRFSS